MKEVETTLNQINRRQALKMTAGGLGYMALGNLLGNEITPPLKPHHEPKAKRVIYLFQAGGP